MCPMTLGALLPLQPSLQALASKPGSFKTCDTPTSWLHVRHATL